MATAVSPPSQAAPTSPAPVNHRVWLRWAVPIGLGIVLRVIPTPAGLSPAAWHFFALFAAVIAAQITEPLPGAATTLIGVCIAALIRFVGKTPAEATKWALSGFSNDTVWLIAAATIFALGYEATGLGRRIALTLVRLLGKRTLGLGYALAVSDLVLAPFMPSNTARSGGTIYPVVKNIPPLYDSTPDKNPRVIGSYLMWTSFATTNVTSAMFITALAPNLLALELAKKIAKVEVTWTQWMIGFLPVGIVLFLLTPLLAYVLYPPEIKRADEVVYWAATELSSMGRISRREITMALLAVIALVAWIAGAKFVTATMVALCVIALMLLTRVVKWADIAANKQAWTTLVWFATLIAMADALNSIGFCKWFADRAAAYMAHYSTTNDCHRVRRALLCCALSVCQPCGPHHRRASRRPRGPGRDERCAVASGHDGADVLHWIDGYFDALCHRSGADLVRQRLSAGQGLLASGLHHGDDLPDRTTCDWRSVADEVGVRPALFYALPQNSGCTRRRHRSGSHCGGAQGP